MKKHWLLTLCLNWLIAFVLGNDTLAQDKQKLNQPQVPLEQLLNRDGTLDLNRGFQGSLDPAGWQMQTGPNGEPRFVPASVVLQSASGAQQLMAAPGDENWDGRFGLPGINSTVRAIAVNGNEVYAGGYFSIAGAAAANYIAKWDGTSWSALGSGMNNVVFTIAVSGDKVYAGGFFTIAGGAAVNYIAKWDGTNWSALGSGMNNGVYTIAVSGGEVYAGGSFTMAGGVAANRIAKWDGTNWLTLGSGMNDAVLDLAVSGGNVYAGGSFTTAGGATANRIAKWDGASWSALGNGMNSTVWAIATAGDEVYAGGWFTTAGDVPAKYIANWNGTSWSALGSGPNDGVLTIAVSDGEVYAGGNLAIAGGVAVNRIAKWDGTSWSAFGSGMNSNVYALTVSGGEVYAGGDFTAAGGVAANRVAKWDGTSWVGLQIANRNGMNAYVHAIAVSGGEVYVGGYLTTAGGVVANHIAKWDGTSWSALGSGITGDVWAIAVSGSDVYVGGTFNIVDGIVANHIAKWDGSSWSALGSGLFYGGAFDIDGRYLPAVSAIAVSGSDVYVGGAFTAAGGVAASRVAKWDGNSWSALGSGVDWFVTSIAVSGSDVYVGGAFNIAGGVGVNHIAKWNGSSWSALGSGVYSRVYAMAVSGSDIYVGGYFFTADGVGLYGIGKWDGSSWSMLGSGLNSLVYAIAVSGGHVYAGGWFTTAGGAPANYIAKWDGASWSALGSGVNYPAWALAVTGGEVYVGGGFTSAGGKPSSYFGRYVSNTPPMITAGGPYSVNEGGSVNVIASGNDPENGPLTYAWDLDNNGSFETAGQSAPFSAANLDGPSSQIIKVQVTDNGGLTATAQATVNVLNVAPTATFSCAPSTIIMGQSAILSFSNPFDPSAADVAAGLTYSYDCANNGTFTPGGASYTCVYPTSGTFTAKGRISDKDGGATTYAAQIVVQTPQQAIGSLIDLVNALVPSVLDPNDAKPLVGKLQGAQAKLDNNKTTTPAINDLQAFINMLNAAINSGKLTPEQGQPLIDAANAIIAVLRVGGALPKNTSLDFSDHTSNTLPAEFRLEQNSPNPFNPVTTIQFSVPRESYVQLKIYNSFGAEVITLVDQQVAAGTYKVNWDASRLASGFYLYRLEAEGFAQTKKLLLMK